MTTQLEMFFNTLRDINLPDMVQGEVACQYVIYTSDDRRFACLSTISVVKCNK